jgi:hypothetical protein
VSIPKCHFFVKNRTKSQQGWALKCGGVIQPRDKGLFAESCWTVAWRGNLVSEPNRCFAHPEPVSLSRYMRHLANSVCPALSSSVSSWNPGAHCWCCARWVSHGEWRIREGCSISVAPKAEGWGVKQPQEKFFKRLCWVGYPWRRNAGLMRSGGALIRVDFFTKCCRVSSIWGCFVV